MAINGKYSLWHHDELVGVYRTLEKAKESADERRRRYNSIGEPGIPFARKLNWDKYGEQWQSSHSGFRITCTE